MSYTKYIFIPIEQPIPLGQMNALVNQLYEALASPVTAINIVHAGVDKTLSIRISYRMDGDDPDDDPDGEHYDDPDDLIEDDDYSYPEHQ